VDAQPEVGQVRPADRDRSGRAQALHLRGVDRRHRVGQGGDARRRRGARDVDVLLDGERHAVQRTRAGVRVRGVRRRPRLLRHHHGDRVQVRVHGLDALQVRVHDLARGDGAFRDHPGQLDGATAPQLLGHFPLLSNLTH
jgi:hypothetical protein